MLDLTKKSNFLNINLMMDYIKIAFVTGGAGHVGSNLVRQLLNNGWRVRCLVHNDLRALSKLNIEICHGSLGDSTFLAKQMEGCDAVFHAAAYVAVENVNIPLMHDINVVGTQNMCQAALAAEIPRFIYFSSIHSFQQSPTNEPLTEQRPLVIDKNAAPYDQTKAEAQRIIYDACNEGLNASILHPTGVLGPFDFKPSRMGQVLLAIMNQKMLFSIDAGFNWVDVRDVCNTAINCVDTGELGQNYIISGEWATFRQIADIISNQIGRRTTYITFPFWTAYTALPFAFMLSKLTGSRPSFSRGSLHALAVQCKDIPGALAKKKLGHSPRPLKETVQDTIKWMQENAD